MSSNLKPAYLIHGTDHGRVAERRARLRGLAESESGSGGVEIFEGDRCTPEMVTNALSSLTFSVGRRFIIVEGVQGWKDKDVVGVVSALKQIDGESLTVAFFAREDGRQKTPVSLQKVVREVGGQIVAENLVKPRDLPKWVRDRAKESGIQLDLPAARTLIARVGDRQQRLLREIEKLSLEYGAGNRIGEDQIRASSSSSNEEKLWTLGDAIVRGDRTSALQTWLMLEQQGERLPGLIYALAKKLRDAYGVTVALEQGQTPAEIKANHRGPEFVIDRLIREVSGRAAQDFRDAIIHLSQVECNSRGAGSRPLAERTLATEFIDAAAGKTAT